MENPDKYRSTGSLRRSTLSLDDTDRKSCSDAKDTITATNDSAPDADGRSILATINNMLSLSLLIDPIFLIFAISNLLTSVGFNSPLYFLPLHATRGLGLDSASASKVLSVYGKFVLKFVSHLFLINGGYPH
ncbi:hypothetical protein OESDEN_01611 [Oesophagostomum dentatum]|uniref:Uncharacterized protein n=1 Tax=Oesophagostomum dentatum TaxID=61180 RepID=A0A0B1TLG0_OESDE|nr:hypothetical protein OESDEN_01611 [Oesophagostomum dentatum]